MWKIVGLAAYIPSFGIQWRRVVSFVLRPFYFRRKSYRHGIRERLLLSTTGKGERFYGTVKILTTFIEVYNELI